VHYRRYGWVGEHGSLDVTRLRAPPPPSEPDIRVKGITNYLRRGGNVRI